MNKSIQAHGYEVKYGQINDTLTHGFRGEYSIVDPVGNPVGGCRTKRAYETAHEAEEAAKVEGIARAEEYANANPSDHDKMRELDDANYYDRGGRIT